MAKERAIVETGEDLSDKKFVKSQLFSDISKVARWLEDPKVKRDNPEEEMAIRNAMKQNIEVFFYDSMLSLHVIKTANYLFIEQYHTGNLNIVPEFRNDIKRENIQCLGGFVPILMVKNDSPFGMLILNHFDNIWKHPATQTNTLEKILGKIRSFEKSPRDFRIEQFLRSANKKSERLLKKEN